jgi:hypothetical protein
MIRSTVIFAVALLPGITPPDQSVDEALRLWESVSSPFPSSSVRTTAPSGEEAIRRGRNRRRVRMPTTSTGEEAFRQ